MLSRSGPLQQMSIRILQCIDQVHDCCADLQADFSGSAKEGGIKHCLQLQDAAAMNPVAYLNGLAKAITDMGGKIYESTRVRKPDRNVLETEAGNKVSTQQPFASSTTISPQPKVA